MTNDTGTTLRNTPALLRTTEVTVVRQVIFTIRGFDHLKQFQRMWEADHGVNLSNNQTLALILEQHQHQQQNPMSAAHHHAR